jgi:hypothetical protein
MPSTSLRRRGRSSKPTSSSQPPVTGRCGSSARTERSEEGRFLSPESLRESPRWRGSWASRARRTSAWTDGRQNLNLVRGQAEPEPGTRVTVEIPSGSVRPALRVKLQPAQLCRRASAHQPAEHAAAVKRPRLAVLRVHRTHKGRPQDAPSPQRLRHRDVASALRREGRLHWRVMVHDRPVGPVREHHVTDARAPGVVRSDGRRRKPRCAHRRVSMYRRP